MTRLVALDTSTWREGVALLESDPSTGGSRTVGEVEIQIEDSHARHLLAVVDRLLSEAGWARTTVDAFAAVRGPGSFTGLRVGLGTVRGLGLASGRPCIGVGTLVAMAHAFGPAACDRIPLLDAGRGEVYGARFDARSAPPVERREPWLGPPSMVIDDIGGDVLVFGSGAEAARNELADRPRGVRVASSPTSIAAAAGWLAMRFLEAGSADGEGMTPLYLRPPDAELPRAGRAPRALK